MTHRLVFEMMHVKIIFIWKTAGGPHVVVLIYTMLLESLLSFSESLHLYSATYR